MTRSMSVQALRAYVVILMVDYVVGYEAVARGELSGFSYGVKAG